MFLTAIAGLTWVTPGHAAETRLQFDVFLGHDGLACEASWTPLTCEIKNDGPLIQGTVEVTTGGNRERTRVNVELPTGTLKRILIPVYCPRGGYASWDVQLLNRRGNVLAEQQNLRPRQSALQDVPLLGSLSRSPAGTPVIRETSIKNSNQMQPASARILTQLFPDNPLVLDGLGSIYLNSERASDLKPGQVAALLQWLGCGGHLIVAVEQPQDLEVSPWLREILPVLPTAVVTVSSNSALHQWLAASWGYAKPERTGSAFRPPAARNSKQGKSASGEPYINPGDELRPFEKLAPDTKFAGAELRVARGELRRGKILVVADQVPLIATADAGRGKVTELLFSPEREPLRSWEHLPVMWAKLVEVPGEWYLSSDFHRYGSWSTDSVFGAMLDTRQAKKLPLGALLLMLLGYLVVIGPADYFLVHRLGRPALTWLTFPAYVAGFSAIMYLVGFRLRAGELEWNELHLVDATLQEETRQVRGRSYGSLYSPANKDYSFRGPEGRSVFRGESGGWYGGGNDEAVSVLLRGESYEAVADVPLWLPQLFASDWVAEGRPPFALQAKGSPHDFELTCENKSDAEITILCVVPNSIVRAGEVRKGGRESFRVQFLKGISLKSAYEQNLHRIQSAVQGRQMAFRRGGEFERLDDWLFVTALLSFDSVDTRAGMYEMIVGDEGLDLSHVLDRPGSVVVFVAADIPPPASPQIGFEPKRSKRLTIWRVILQVQDSPGNT